LRAQVVDSERVDLILEMEEPRPLAVIASRSGFRQCGVFLPLTKPLPEQVHLMLVPNGESLAFSKDLRKELVDRQPNYQSFLESDPQNAERIEALAKDQSKQLACLLNILEAIRWLPSADSIIPTLEKIQIQIRTNEEEANHVWRGMQQDRAFVVAKDTLVPLLEDTTVFRKETSLLHPLADKGFKEFGRLGEANLNFNVNTASLPADLGPNLVQADIDLDFFDDKLAHISLEVIPNMVTKFFGKPKLTNPAQIFALRWMATKNFQGDLMPVGVTGPRPDFNPLYTITPG